MARYEVSNDRLGILHGMTTPGPAGAHTEAKRAAQTNGKRAESPRAKSSGRHKSENGVGRFRFKKRPKVPRPAREKNSEGSSKQQRCHPQTKFTDDPTEYDDSYIPNAASWSYAQDPDAAFRESLFDAMADDEGAAFWEGVYGQPIHIYSRQRIFCEGLESMTDEEYARYVRERMWEKSHQHIVEERERRAKARASELEEERRQQRERERYIPRQKAEGREASGYKGRRPRQPSHSRTWESYNADWSREKITDASDIPWPVFSGQLRDVNTSSVNKFLRSAVSGRDDDTELLNVLKKERVRWHPDKAQQRWGNAGMTESHLKAVTTIFQTVAQMLDERVNSHTNRSP